MTPRWLTVIFLIGVGSVVLAIAYRGYHTGELPAGSNGFAAPYRPNRNDNPLAFHFFLILYGVAGISLCVWGLLAMIGLAPPIAWR
jgi:hypothetical protein